MNPNHTLTIEQAEKLFDQYVDQTICAEDLAQLEAWICADPANADRFSQWSLTHGHSDILLKNVAKPRHISIGRIALFAAAAAFLVLAGKYFIKDKNVTTASARLPQEHQDDQPKADEESELVDYPVPVNVPVEVTIHDTSYSISPSLSPGQMAGLYANRGSKGRRRLLPGISDGSLTDKEWHYQGSNQFNYDGLATGRIAGERVTNGKDVQGRKIIGYKNIVKKVELSIPVGTTYIAKFVTVTNSVPVYATNTVQITAQEKEQKLKLEQWAAVTIAQANHEKVMANQLMQQGFYKEAVAVYHQALRLYPNHQLAEPHRQDLVVKIEIARKKALNIDINSNREQYAAIFDNKFKAVIADPLSTFSVDVDTASYANVRRFLTEGSLPNPSAVRIEEMLNYFDYEDAPPHIIKAGQQLGEALPFATHTQLTDCPWATDHKLLRIAIKGADIEIGKRPPAHLTFLLDVSGSMDVHNKLPLVKQAMTRLAGQLREADKVSIVVYAGAAGAVLEAKSGYDQEGIIKALNQLKAGGSTAGGQGIELAYSIAAKHYIPNGVNRIILCTDGDFNVGTSDTGSLVKLVQEKANPEDGRGVYLSVCGFGTGNLNDSMMEQITGKGNGTYHYIDSTSEAEKVFVRQVGENMVTIAKDVKLQLEFNPSKVSQYRLIGYENRVLANQDFNDDTVDAGDIGAGHSVVALYEIVPAGKDPYVAAEQERETLKKEIEKIEAFIRKADLTATAELALQKSIMLLKDRLHALTTAPDRSVDSLKYQTVRTLSEAADTAELLTLKLRYKRPDAKAEQGTSKLLTFTVPDKTVTFDKAHHDTRFAASVAAFGMILRESPFKGTATLGWARKTAANALGKDKDGDRAGLLKLMDQAARLKDK